MPQFQIDDVIDAHEETTRYRYRMEQQLDGATELLYEVGIDRAASRHHILLGRDWESFPAAEAHYRPAAGVCRRVDSEDWFEARDQRPPDVLEQVLTLLVEHDPESVEAIPEGVRIEYDLDALHLPVRDRPVEFFETVFEGHDQRTRQAFLAEIAAVATELTGSLRITVDEDSLVRAVNVDYRAPDVSGEMRLTLEAFGQELPAFPAVDPRQDAPALNPSTLLFRMEQLGGWSQKLSHAPWAQRSLALLEREDAAREYPELYADTWGTAAYTESVARKGTHPSRHLHHPTVLGAYHEDAEGQFESDDPFYDDWFDQDPAFTGTKNFRPGDYKRSYHHFGGRDTGLRRHWLEEWYFVFHSPPPTTEGDRFYSARNWGYGGNRIDEGLNKLTFTRAIEQYNRYSRAGVRNALLMLGHVLHLLQDQGMPDHANRVAHPGSGFTQHGAYSEFGYCHIVATEAALLACAPCGPFCPACMATAFGVTEGVCYGRAKAESADVGYERLIADTAHVTGAQKRYLWRLDRVDNAIDATGPRYRDTYDQFFHDLSDFSTSEAAQRGLDSPLGLDHLALVPPVPGCEPAIDSGDPDDYNQYLELTDELVPEIVGYGAGLLQYFYRTVNHPPYLRRVTVVKGASGLTPQGYAEFDPALEAATCEKLSVRYDASWERTDGGRTLNVDVDRPLSPDHDTYLFVQFGPQIDTLGAKTVDTETLDVSVTGPELGEPVSVELQEATDPQHGTYYWGRFEPPNPTAAPLELDLEVAAEDATAHLQRRQHPGDELDSAPATLPTVDASSPWAFPLQDYQPGTDRNHSLTVGRPLEVEATSDDTFDQATAVHLGVSTTAIAEDNRNAVGLAGTLHDATDEDFYRVEFDISEFDNQVTKGWTKDIGGGLYAEFSPPRLSVSVDETYGACVDISLYHSDETLYRRIPNAETVTVQNPSREFDDQTFYLVVRNPDFDGQGALCYDVNLAYWPFFGVVKGRLLYKFWEFGDDLHPWEDRDGVFPVGDPPESMAYLDPGDLVSDLEQFVPHQIRDLGLAGRRARVQQEATAFEDVGHVARAFHLDDTAVSLLTRSATRFDDLGLRDRAESVREQIRELRRR